MCQFGCSFATSHGGPIHDTQLDYYGQQLATASADHTIRIWDLVPTDPQQVTSDQPTLQAELKGHEGPVWEVAWAHPKFGKLVASCGYDKRVIIWRKDSSGTWMPVYKSEDHAASVNSVAFAPCEFGLVLAAASGDGSVSVISYRPHDNGAWTRKTFPAHASGANAVSWAPSSYMPSMSPVASEKWSPRPPRLATGGCDSQIRVWDLDEASGDWVEGSRFAERGHSAWVRDVAFRPNLAPSGGQTLASGGEDGVVVIWRETESHLWRKSQTINIGEPVWKISWSIAGTNFAVAAGDDSILVFKESPSGLWEKLDDVPPQENGQFPQE